MTPAADRLLQEVATAPDRDTAIKVAAAGLRALALDAEEHERLIERINVIIAEMPE